MRAIETEMGSGESNEAGRPEAAQKRKTWRRSLKIMFSICTGLFIVVASAVTIFFLYQLNDLPTVPEMKKGCFNVDGGEFEGLYRPLPLAAIPSLVQRAFLAMGDSNFYRVKRGYKPLDVFIAYYRWAIKSNFFFDPPAIHDHAAQQCLSVVRKKYDGYHKLIKKSLLYLRIETGLTRDEILEIYLNSIYFGHNAYGVEAGAQTYFGKSVAELTIAEVAQLAALTRARRAPALPGPTTPTGQKRKLYALDRMVQLEIISEEEAVAAEKEEIAFKVLKK